MEGEARADGVEVDITEGVQEVGGIEGAGEEAVMPEVSDAIAGAVQFDGVLRVGLGER